MRTSEIRVERVQGTILQECWKPAFARYLVLKLTGLQRELTIYLKYYNEERALEFPRSGGRITGWNRRFGDHLLVSLLWAGGARAVAPAA